MKNNIKAYKTFGISPMLSIIVPVYNVEKYLGECLDSVISQDADDYEVVLVNDGSTDDSLVVLKEYEKKYPHCHVYNKVNGGLSSARNYGVDKATGKYVYFLDSDDKFYDDKCISFMIEELQKANLDALYFDGESFFESRKLQEQNPFYVNAYQRKNSYGDFYKGESLFKAFVEHGEYFPSSCLACYRKSFLQEHSLSFDEGYLYEDNLFTFKVMLSAKTVRHIDRKVLSRRVRAGSITQSSLTFENLKSYLRAWLQMRKFWEERKTGDASEAMGIIVDGVKSGVVLSYNSLSPSERERIAELSPYERHELKSALPASVDNGNGEYIFPYMFMKKNSAVAIYGAGKVGRAFYGQATRCDFVRIVAWVDANAAAISAENLPVTTPDSLKNALFDYVLIAIEREDVANGARQTLLDLGVPNSKILWFGNYYPWNFAYDRIIYPLTEILRKLAVSGEKRLWLFMLPEHGNMGDYAIGYAASDFLKKFFPDYSLIDITEGEWHRLSVKIKSLVDKNDILFLNGGGDFGDLWNTGKVQRDIVNTFPDNKIIFLPNTLTYQGEISENNPSLMQDMAFCNSRKDVHIIFREKNSYEFASKYVKNVYCYPDMVLSKIVPRETNSPREGVLLVFRSDKERVFNGRERIKKILDENRLQYAETDIHQMRYVSQDEGRKILESITKKLQSAEVVITDRLHGMILSLISQTPCIAFDNSTKKISGVYAWLKDCPNVLLSDEAHLDDLTEQIAKVSAVPCDFKPLDTEFQKMAEEIRKIIG